MCSFTEMREQGSSDENPIPISFDLAWILLVYHIENTYSRTIREWIQTHPIRIVDRRNPSAIEPPFENECIRIRWTGSSRRLLETVGTLQVNRSKARRPQQRPQSNIISKYFHPIQAATPRKREGQGQTGNSSKVKFRKINARIIEVHDTSNNEYEHRQKRRAHREDDRIP